MRIKWMLLVVAAAIVTGCEFKCSVGGDGGTTKEVTSTESNGPLKGAVLKNDIVLDAKNVKVKGAYLADNAGNALNKNEVALGEKIRCVVVLDTGWTKYDNKSFVGMSEKLMTEDGSVIVDEADLFKSYDETGIAATDAGTLSVISNIDKKQPGIDDYKVQFRIWDKKGNGEVTGSFKFKVN